MPIYTIHCKYCNEKYEIQKLMTDPYPITCKKCGKKGGIERDFGADTLSLTIPEHMKAGFDRPNYAPKGKEMDIPDGFI